MNHEVYLNVCSTVYWTLPTVRDTVKSFYNRDDCAVRTGSLNKAFCAPSLNG